MIIDISDSAFKRIFEDEQLHLPIRWDGKNFLYTLAKLYNSYIKNLTTKGMEHSNEYYGIQADITLIKIVCKLIKKTVSHYLNGFPSKAYETFSYMMEQLIEYPLEFYKTNFNEKLWRNNLDLFRVVCVNDNIPYNRSRVFHTPYNLRSKVSTSRYSISGYPSLYLGTSLELCCEEINYYPHKNFAVASRFEIQENNLYNDYMINIIDLAIKPQDFLPEREHENGQRYGIKRNIVSNILDNYNIKGLYLIWYPLIAACSYIRVNKSDPFAVEYIIPQLLMQWVRNWMSDDKNMKYKKIIGIRYFSCASVKASDMGFNYVFPASGKKHKKFPFCPVLMNAFSLTKPYFLHEFDNIKACEQKLIRDKNLLNIADK